jgi:hypothetical protein
MDTKRPCVAKRLDYPLKLYIIHHSRFNMIIDSGIEVLDAKA